MKSFAILSFISSVLAVQHSAQSRLHDSDSEIDYDNPVRSAVDDEITALPGLNDAIDFRQYSGYLNADSDGDKFHHYWFVESSHDPENSPILLWLNGGPGCSSMDGLLAELGPFDINDDGKTLKLRTFTWNKVANVLFMESPVGVGYSYSKGSREVLDDDKTAADNFHALKSFFKKFPQYKNNSLYLAGESYAGVYLPTLGVLVDKDPEMNFKGIAIGNGYLDAKKLYISMIFFSYYHGFAGKTTWDEISKFCCNNKPPTREDCDFQTLDEDCISAAGGAFKTMKGLNPYNIYADCARFDPLQRNGHQLSRDMVDRHLMDHRIFSQTSNPFMLNTSTENQLRGGAPCVDSHLLIRYMNQASVRTALHVPYNLGGWELCSSIHYNIQYPLLDGGLAPQMKQLIDSKRKLKMVVYNGDVDSVCNFLGDEWFVEELGRKVVKEYSPWKVGKQIGGWVKHYDGIAYVTVRGSGHMVPQDRPKEALAMIERFLGARNGTMIDL